MLFSPPDQFGCLAWSHSETHLLYVAEKKRPKAESFFKPKAPVLSSEEELTKTEQQDKAVKVGPAFFQSDFNFAWYKASKKGSWSA